VRYNNNRLMARRGEKLKIAIIAPPWLSLYPGCYYGIEILLQNLASRLTERGHHVELFTVGGSKTKVNKIHWYHKKDQYQYIHRPYYESASIIIAHLQYALNIILEEGDFDIVHDHNSYLGPAVLANIAHMPPVLHTLHEPFTDRRLLARGIPDNRLMFEQFRHIKNLYFNGISNAQLSNAPNAIKGHIKGVVYNGVDLDDYLYSSRKNSYMAFVGSLTPEKGIDVAARVCFELGLKLKIAGTIGGGIKSPAQLKRELKKTVTHEREDPIFGFFKAKVLSYLKPRQIEYLGSVSGLQKRRLYAHARAFLNPIDRDEPFGISVVEALASGTPVVTYNRGAMPEIIEHGVNGFIANNYTEFKQYVRRVGEIDPQDCRRSVTKRFTADIMTKNYVDLYRKIIFGK
jgi:glycosyltransferase involved in cell wall biosynthesis